MNKRTFLNLFDGNNELSEAAESWWEAVENCEHPFSRLWFRHWQEETRALPKIAFAFRKAVQLGFHKTSENALACEIFDRLYSAGTNGTLSKKALGLFSGDEISRNSVPVQSVTFVGIDVPENSWDVEIVEKVTLLFQRNNSKKELNITWLAPIEDIPGQFTNDTLDIDLIRDKLGLPHLSKEDFIVCIRWPENIAFDSHIPTILDGRWAFWRPAPIGSSWGKTMDLATGDSGFRESVIGGERTEWELVGGNSTPCRWKLGSDYDRGADGRFAELCELLLEKKNTMMEIPNHDY